MGTPCLTSQETDAAWPGPGGAQDEGQKQHFDHDAEAVEDKPGLADRVEHRDRDVERWHEEVEHAVRTGGQCHGEHDHEGRDPHERERTDYGSVHCHSRR